jgi:hypothetical protein
MSNNNNNIYEEKEKSEGKKSEYRTTRLTNKNSYWKVERKKIPNVFDFLFFFLSFNAHQKKQSGDLPNTMRLCFVSVI